MKEPIKISAVIFARNAVAIIEKTISSLVFADEVVVIDLESTDKTAAVARALGARVVTHPNVGYVEPIRNFGISEASGDWILVLDGDEVVSPGLGKKLRDIADEKSDPHDPSDAYYLPRKNMIFGEFMKSAGWWPDHVLRFFKKNHVEWTTDIHSIPITLGKVAELPANENEALIHFNYTSVTEFVERFNKYSTIQAAEDAVKKQSASSSKLALESFFGEFLSRVFARGGIDGGAHGLIVSLLQSSSEMVRVAKVWEHNGFKEEANNSTEIIEYLRQFRGELAYWIADWQAQHTTGLPRLFWRLRRRFQL